MVLTSASSSAKITEIRNREAADEAVACPTHLIDDLPSEKDQFASPDGIGPHERVGRAIAEMILSPTEAGGRMIALEGDWGAGKTTVIGLLKKRLEDCIDLTVFSYDAWAHEGDPLRRTFLESLIRHFQNLGENGWINQEKAKRILDNLANRRKVTKTRTIPRITKLGKIFALSVLLVPISSPLLTTALRDGITLAFDTSKPFSWTLFFGILCALAPFLVILGNLVWIKTKSREKTMDSTSLNPNCSENNEQDLDDWAFIGSHSITETTQETIETPQPTSIEFQDEFCNVMGEALNGKKDRKIVMVLDNLDRVDPKDALSIWSTLQTFLQCSNDKTTEWFKKLWIVIPYDPQGLRQLWMNRNKGEEETLSAGSTEFVPESFMDKSFQLRFRVPAPLLSNWKEYLRALTLQALPKHTPEELYKIYQVYRLVRVKDNMAPTTPRELKLFVNQIGTIHRQWQHEFPLDHMAYYTILCRTGVNIREGLLNGKIPDSTIQGVLSPNLPANLAGLYFNVAANLGQQLLLAAPISNALTDGDKEQLTKLEKTHNEGFWAVLENIMIEKGHDTTTAVANTAICLEESGLLDNQTRTERNTILTALKRLALSINVWIPFDIAIARGISSVCRLVSDPMCSKQILKSLQETVANPSNNNLLSVNEKTIQALANICEEITQIGHSDALKPFKIVTSPDEWVQVCPHVHKQDERLWPLFVPQLGFDAISNALKGLVLGGKFSNSALATIQVTHRSLTDCDWTVLSSTLQDRINANQNLTTTETNLLLKGLALLKRLGCSQANSSLELLATSGHLMHRLHQAHSEQDTVCSARLLTTFLEQRPGADKPTPVGNSEAGYSILVRLLGTDNVDLADQILTILDMEEKTNMLFEIVDKRKTYDPLIVACLRLIADSGTPGRLFTPDEVINRWWDLEDQLNKNDDGRFDRLLGNLCANSMLDDAVQKREEGFDYQNAWLYFRICKACPSLTFREWCRVGLEALDSNVWTVQLDGKGNVFDLLLFLIDEGISIALKQPFQDALVAHAKKLLIGKAKLEEDVLNQRHKLLDTLGPDSRKVFRRRLLLEAMNRDGKCAEAFFQVYGEELSKDTTQFYEDKEIVARLFSPLLRERNASGLSWLNSIFGNAPDLLKKSTDRAAVGDFLERLQGEFKRPANDDDQIHALILEIATTLGIAENDAGELDVNDLEMEGKSPLKILKAEYWTPKVRLEVTEELRKSVVSNRLEIIASNEIKGDPDPGTVKKLTIQYRFDSDTMTKEFTEGERVVIP